MTVQTEQTEKTPQAQPIALSAQYQALMQGMAELENIPGYRPDLKAEEAQKLTQKAIQLSGQLVITVEHQQQRLQEIESRLDHIDKVADKLFAWLEGKEGWEHEES